MTHFYHHLKHNHLHFSCYAARFSFLQWIELSFVRKKRYTLAARQFTLERACYLFAYLHDGDSDAQFPRGAIHAHSSSGRRARGDGGWELNGSMLSLTMKTRIRNFR